MSTINKKMWLCFFIAVVIFTFIPIIVPRFWVAILTEILILGLAGMSVNFLLGYGGCLPFGHAAFYATGIYTTAILIEKANVPLAFALIVSPLASALFGAIIALLVARLYKFYFAIMTLAFSMLLWSIIRKLTNITGGDTGITAIDLPSFFQGISEVYFFTLIIVSISIFALWIITNSPFGWTLRAIKENPIRIGFTSINVVKHRFSAFVISSFFCGIAGTLYAVYSRTAYPDYGYWTVSGDFVTIVILGGMNFFFGPLIGAVILTVLHTVLTSLTLYWPLILGIIIIIVVLVMPDGIIGIFILISGKIAHQNKQSNVMSFVKAKQSFDDNVEPSHKQKIAKE